jgi:hypothetical protein
MVAIQHAGASALDARNGLDMWLLLSGISELWKFGDSISCAIRAPKCMKKRTG